MNSRPLLFVLGTTASLLFVGIVSRLIVWLLRRRRWRYVASFLAGIFFAIFCAGATVSLSNAPPWSDYLVVAALVAEIFIFRLNGGFIVAREQSASTREGGATETGSSHRI